MRYIVNAILNDIEEQRPRKDEQLRVRISGFEDVRIYEAVAKKLHEIYGSEISLETRLSREKWAAFKADSHADQTALLSMESHGWIAENNSLTYYRNLSLEKAQLIVIMGTEVVDDQGGLSDFFYIDPEKLTAEMGSEYYRAFEHILTGWDTEEQGCVNKLYKDLFALVPANICKLSDVADTWGSMPTIQEFVEHFFEELPSWGLCVTRDKIPPVSKILKSEKTNLLQLNYDFITRKLFKKMTQKQYEKYLTKISKYQIEQCEYDASWDGWAKQNTKSLLSFTEVLCQFIRGENLAAARKALLGVDFAVTEYVLGITLPVIVKPKQKKWEINGSPYEAFMKAIFTSLSYEDPAPFDALAISIISVELANAVDPLNDADEETQLAEGWEKVCWFAGGVLQYIDNLGLEANGVSISLAFEKSVFDPKLSYQNVQSGLVSTASASKKLDKVVFEITHVNQEKETNISHTFEWRFSLHDAWAITFEPICSKYIEFEDAQIDSLLPLSTASQYDMLMGSKSEEEFLDYFEQTTIDFDCNLVAEAEKHHESEKALSWRAAFSALGREFIAFCKSIREHGFFGDMFLNSRGESKIASFIDRYVKMGAAIVDSSFTSNMEWVMNYYIHAFSIEESDRAITTDEDGTGCIIPPYHPAILQKLVDRVVFIADGACEWLRENEEAHASFDRICAVIDELSQLSQIQEGVDVYPAKEDGFLGTTRAYANYCICGTNKAPSKKWMKAILQKDAVFDDDFNDGTFKNMNVSAKMLLDVIETYVEALPNNATNLSIAIVDPDDLQPIIAAVYQYIVRRKKILSDDVDIIHIRLNILVKPENKGGRNYLSYWANTFFNQDENVDLKIYLNEWRDKDDLDKLLAPNMDLIFLMDVLKVNKLCFILDNSQASEHISDCRFPIVYKPAPVSASSIKRRIELTQKQFSAATTHSQVVYYKDTYESYAYQRELVVREVSIDQERKDLILLLHKKTNWVICVDGGMDGALLRDGNGENNDYAIIGFSTGKGPHGQYNLTITARTAIINAVKERLKARLQKLFSWDKAKTYLAADVCMNEARNLDGVSLLSAINPRDNKINEFLAYIMASLQAKQENKESALQVVVHLDSYQHWFEDNVLEEAVESKSRPDFLQISANLGENGKIQLVATVIECKIALYSNADERKNDAIQQVQHGIKHLSTIFDPNSHSIRRRYWFAQLYRALAFSQITFQSDTKAFARLSEEMRNILEGEFEITWSGRIMGYWKDMPGDDEVVTTLSSSPRIVLHEVPQKRIQRILLNDANANVSYVPVTETSDMDVSDESKVLPSDQDEYKDSELYSSNDQKKEDDQEVKTVETSDCHSSDAPLEVAARDAIPVVATEEPAITQAGTSNEGSSIAHTQAKDNQSMKELKDIRVYVGKDGAGNKVYWDFGHPKLANRHLLITGTSGQGKTYSIQAMLKELAQEGVSSVIFDYTEGFREDQLEPAFRTALSDRISQNVVYFTGIPIDPFRRQEIEIAGMRAPEKISDVAQRIATIFTHVYDFGEQQFAAIYEACSNAISTYGNATDMEKFREKLGEVKNAAAKTVMSKMIPFFDSVEFQKGTTFDWNTVIQANGSVIIFQLTNYVREIQVIITELMLWDAWHYFKKNGDKNTPFVVVLDEAQNLSMKMGSPAEIILREGRKFGWSAWFATQSLKSLSDVEVVNLHQAPYSLYFKPTDDEIVKISKQIDPVTSSKWVGYLKGLHKGQCIVTGDRVRFDGTFGAVKPTITNISSFEERENDRV